MIITLVSVILFVILVAVVFLGGRLARVLPEEQLSAESKDAMKLALGLVATMTAILLGLLISSAKGSFDTARSQVMQMAAKVALDRKSTRLNSSHRCISYAVFCLKKKKKKQ